MMESQGQRSSDIEGDHLWTHVSVMCLLELLWEQCENPQGITKKELFEVVTDLMKKNGFSYSSIIVRRKYTNMSKTYRDNRKKLLRGGKVNWPYYELFHEIYKREKQNFRSESPTPSEDKRPASPLDHPDDLPPSPSLPPRPKRKRISVFDEYPKGKSSLMAQEFNLGVSDDCASFSNEWQAGRYNLEEQKINLIDSLFRDLKAQRYETEKAKTCQLEMHSAKNKHLKLILKEMSQLRIDMKREISSLSEGLQTVISAIQNSCSRPHY